MVSAKPYEITIQDTARDLAVLIDLKVAQFASRRYLDDQTKQKLATFLSDRANGMFLWVVLVMKELERREDRLTDELIASKLEMVPMTLATAYEAILNAPRPSRQSDLWRIIRWLLNARRLFTVAELERALCLEVGEQWHSFVGDLNFLCGSLLRIEHSTVSFLHQTVRDFLLDYTADAPTEMTGGIGMTTIETETLFATTCVRFLLETSNMAELDEIIQKGMLPNTTDVEEYFQSRPFFGYAGEFWYSHLNELEAPETELISLVKELFESDLKRDILKRMYSFFRHSKHPRELGWGPKLQLAAYFNIPSLVVEYIRENHDPRRDTGAGCPLIWASETGSYKCVEILLSAGADPNQVEYDGWSPLHWAATNGHSEVCRLLIDHGADKEAEDSRGYTPKDKAVQLGYYELAKTYFGRIEDAKPWTPSVESPRVSFIEGGRIAALPES